MLCPGPPRPPWASMGFSGHDWASLRFPGHPWAFLGLSGTSLCVPQVPSPWPPWVSWLSLAWTNAELPGSLLDQEALPLKGLRRVKTVSKDFLNALEGTLNLERQCKTFQMIFKALSNWALQAWLDSGQAQDSCRGGWGPSGSFGGAPLEPAAKSRTVTNFVNPYPSKDHRKAYYHRCFPSC